MKLWRFNGTVHFLNLDESTNIENQLLAISLAKTRRDMRAVFLATDDADYRDDDADDDGIDFGLFSIGLIAQKRANIFCLVVKKLVE